MRDDLEEELGRKGGEIVLPSQMARRGISCGVRLRFWGGGVAGAELVRGLPCPDWDFRLETLANAATHLSGTPWVLGVVDLAVASQKDRPISKVRLLHVGEEVGKWAAGNGPLGAYLQVACMHTRDRVHFILFPCLKEGCSQTGSGSKKVWPFRNRAVEYPLCLQSSWVWLLHEVNWSQRLKNILSR